MANLAYNEAERCLHEAILLLDTSEHSETQPFIEAKAVVLDKASESS